MPIIDQNTADDLFAGKTFNGTGPFSGQEVHARLRVSACPATTSTGRAGGPISTASRSVWSAPVPVDAVRAARGAGHWHSTSRPSTPTRSRTTRPISSSPPMPTTRSPTWLQRKVAAARQPTGAAGQSPGRSTAGRILTQVSAASARPPPCRGHPSPLPSTEQKPATTTRRGKAKQLLGQAGADGKRGQRRLQLRLRDQQSIAEIIQFDLPPPGCGPAAAAPGTGLPRQAAERRYARPLPDRVTASASSIPPRSSGAFPFNSDKNASIFDTDAVQGPRDKLWLRPGQPGRHSRLARVNDFLLDRQFVSDLVASSHTFTISTKLQGLRYTM